MMMSQRKKLFPWSVEGHEQGTILASEAELIHNVFEFDDKEVKDIMTHRKIS